MALFRQNSELLPERRGVVPRRGRRFGGRITKQRFSRFVFTTLALLFLVCFLVSGVKIFFYGEFFRSFVCCLILRFLMYIVNCYCVLLVAGTVEDIISLSHEVEDVVSGSNFGKPPPKSKHHTPPPKSKHRKQRKNSSLVSILFYRYIRFYEFNLCVRLFGSWKMLNYCKENSFGKKL